MAQHETEHDPSGNAELSQPPVRTLPPEARRALAEAEERRRLAASPQAAQKEVGGRNGPDPVRYGDWEKGGIVSDF